MILTVMLIDSVNLPLHTVDRVSTKKCTLAGCLLTEMILQEDPSHKQNTYRQIYHKKSSIHGSFNKYTNFFPLDRPMGPRWPSPRNNFSKIGSLLLQVEVSDPTPCGECSFPSRGLTYPTLGKGIVHLQNAIFGGIC